MQLFKRSKSTIAFFLFIQIVIAQQFPSKNITSIDGLANNSIYSILKDSNGALWLGTGNGVSTIIDDKITNYTVEDGLAHNNCWSITEDKNGVLWFGSNGGGLTYFDGKKFKVLNEANGLINNSIRKLFTNKDKLYVGTAYGLSVIDINTKRITNIEQKSNFDRFQIMDFYEYQNEVYLGTHRDGIWQINHRKERLEFVVNNVERLFSIYKNNENILITQDGNLNLSKGINIFDVNNLSSKVIPIESLGSSVFWQFTKDKRNTIYGVADGINFPSGGVFKISNGYENYTNKFNIESKSLWCIFYDVALDKLYIGSLDKGLFIVDLNETIKFFDSNEVIDVFNQNEITFLLTSNNFSIKKNNEIQSNINISDFREFASKFYKKGVNRIGHSFFNYFKTKDFSELKFESFKRISNKNYIDSPFGLFEVNDVCEILNLFPIDTDVFEFISNEEILYFRPYSFPCVTNNLYAENPKTIRFELANKNNPRDVSGILKANSNVYIISKTTGLYKYTKGEFVSYLESKTWSEKELNHIAKNKQQLIVSNTNGNIFVIDDSKEFKIIKKISQKEIIGNTITFLEAYNDYVIIGTDRGINFYKDNIIRFIDEEQGLENKIFTSSSIDNDVLFIGTTKGYYKVDLLKLLNQKLPNNKVQIENIDVNYKSVYKNELLRNKSIKKNIELAYNENIINIAFLTKSHIAPKKILFRHKVIGLNNNDWSNWNSSKSINLPYLPNGNFKIILEIKDLFYGEVYKQELLSITINPPFWKTWWFILLVALSFSVIVIVYYKNRINKIKAQEAEKSKIQKRLTETKMEALQSQMNPHFIFNAMNSIQNYIIDNNTDDALMFMGEFSKIIRQTLNNSSQQKISLLEELQYIQSYITLENMRFKDKIDLIINIDDKIDLMDIEIPPMLVQPFIENVFVHAFDSTIKEPKLFVNFNLVESVLKIEIQDNGHGVSANSMDKLHTSKGIKLAKERLALFSSSSKNEIEINSEKNSGTSVIITIDLNV